MGWTSGVAARRVTLLLLRVTMGFLMVWWGLDRAIATGLGVTISDTFYHGMFSVALLQRGFGVLELALGVLVVLGLYRAVTLPLMALLNAFTAAMVWYAIIDPFKLWLPPRSDFPFTQLFYPSAIIFAAALVLIAFRGRGRAGAGPAEGRHGLSVAVVPGPTKGQASAAIRLLVTPWASDASRNLSRSPSRTAWVLLVSTLVRRSFTIL